MTNKLRELQEQASPGPWKAHGELVLGPGEDVPHKPLIGTGLPANAKLAALAPHLLPIAEALKKASDECELWIDYLPDMVKPDRLQAETAGIRARVADYRNALKNLKEALDA